MKIETLSDLLRLEYALKDAFGEIPKNLIVESKDILTECQEHMGRTSEIKSTITDTQIWNIRVMGEAIEVVQD